MYIILINDSLFRGIIPRMINMPCIKNIKVNLKKSNNNIILLIDDDGPGIPKNEYENVFKPFYKIDKSRNETKSSVGLGMSIASDIIQSHGGNIKLEKSILKGLKVKITLPF